MCLPRCWRQSLIGERMCLNGWPLTWIKSRDPYCGDPKKRHRAVRSNAQLRRFLFVVGSTGDPLALARDVLLGMSRIAPFVLQYPS